MGGILISVAKLVIYTLCAGIHPARVLPVVLDCGTDVSLADTYPLSAVADTMSRMRNCSTTTSTLASASQEHVGRGMMLLSTSSSPRPGRGTLKLTSTL